MDAVRGFTSACGQSIYRGNKFPYDSRGAYFFCDPTIHVVRRAYVEYPEGKLLLRKAEPEGQGIHALLGFQLPLHQYDNRGQTVASTSPICTGASFRMRPGSIKETGSSPRRTGVNKHVQMGRIWRIRHKDHQPYGKKTPHARGIDC